MHITGHLETISLSLHEALIVCMKANEAESNCLRTNSLLCQRFQHFKIQNKDTSVQQDAFKCSLFAYGVYRFMAVGVRSGSTAVWWVMGRR